AGLKLLYRGRDCSGKPASATAERTCNGKPGPGGFRNFILFLNFLPPGAAQMIYNILKIFLDLIGYFCGMKKWIAAARLRTLPLSISGIILGSLIALSEGFWDWRIFVLAFLTTLFLQVLSNYANDYGDGIRGTDAERIGEKRAVASGEITAKQMKNAV